MSRRSDVFPLKGFANTYSQECRTLRRYFLEGRSPRHCRRQFTNHADLHPVSALYGWQYFLWLRLYRRPDPDNACRHAAQLIVQALKKHFATSQRPFVLGLPTGGSPLGVYGELVRLYKAGEISFKASS